MFENEKIVAIAITHWHIMGIMSYLISRYGSIDNKKVIIIIFPHPKDGYLIDKNEFDHYDNISIFFKEEIPQKKYKFLKVPILLASCFIFHKKSVFEVIMPRNIYLNMLLNIISIKDMSSGKIKIICVDEGVGTYFSNKVWKRCSISEGDYNIYIKFKNYIAFALKKVLKSTDWNMMEKRDVLIPNYNIVEYYKYAIESTMICKYKENMEPNFFSETMHKAIFLSQPWSETGQITFDEETQFVNRTIRYLHGKKYKIYIKPHPRENANKFEKKSNDDISILSLDIPAECYFKFLTENDIVIGYNSTSLITAKVIFNIEAFTLVDKIELGKKDNMMSEAFKEFEIISRGLIRPVGDDFY